MVLFSLDLLWGLNLLPDLSCSLAFIFKWLDLDLLFKHTEELQSFFFGVPIETTGNWFIYSYWVQILNSLLNCSNCAFSTSWCVIWDNYLSSSSDTFRKWIVSQASCLLSKLSSSDSKILRASSGVSLRMFSDSSGINSEIVGLISNYWIDTSTKPAFLYWSILFKACS